MSVEQRFSALGGDMDALLDEFENSMEPSKINVADKLLGEKRDESVSEGKQMHHLNSN